MNFHLKHFHGCYCTPLDPWNPCCGCSYVLPDEKNPEAFNTVSNCLYIIPCCGEYKMNVEHGANMYRGGPSKATLCVSANHHILMDMESNSSTYYETETCCPVSCNIPFFKVMQYENELPLGS